MRTYRKRPGPSCLQLGLYQFIIDHVEEHGYQPPMRVMCDFLGVSSINAVWYHLKCLERAGYVRRKEAKGLELPRVRFMAVPREPSGR